MLARLTLFSTAVSWCGLCLAQSPPATTGGAVDDSNWRGAGGASRAAISAGSDDVRYGQRPASDESLTPVATTARQPIAKVTSGTGSLPNEHGQVWREYDISPYTLRVTSTNRPEQAIVDWILRETGYEAWHAESVSILSAGRRTLRVYHTPEMHAVVSDMVDRFVNSQAESHAFSVRVITVDSPNWRARAQPMLQPIAVESPGVQAWLLTKEDAALLLSQLRQRTDFREHSSPQMLVNNGQSTVVSATRSRPYIKGVISRPDIWPSFETEMSQIDEGYALELNPLLSVDGASIDAVVKCNVDQVEKVLPVMLEVPSQVARAQRTKIEVPQVVSCRVHERFRWPTSHVLLVGLGVVPTPVPQEPNVVQRTLSLPASPARADLLVVVESQGPTDASITSANGEKTKYRGRY